MDGVIHHPIALLQDHARHRQGKVGFAQPGAAPEQQAGGLQREMRGILLAVFEDPRICSRGERDSFSPGWSE